MKQNQLPHQHGTHKNLESLSEQLADIDRFASIAEIFKRLGDANRVRIF